MERSDRGFGEAFVWVIVILAEAFDSVGRIKVAGGILAIGERMLK